MTDDDIKRIYERLNDISREVGETKMVLKSFGDTMKDLRKSVDKNSDNCQSLVNKLDLRVNKLEKYFAQLKVAGVITIAVISAVCTLIIAITAYVTYFK